MASLAGFTVNRNTLAKATFTVPTFGRDHSAAGFLHSAVAPASSWKSRRNLDRHGRVPVRHIPCGSSAASTCGHPGRLGTLGTRRLRTHRQRNPRRWCSTTTVFRRTPTSAALRRTRMTPRWRSTWQRLRNAGFTAAVDGSRGYDHGVFAPLEGRLSRRDDSGNLGFADRSLDGARAARRWLNAGAAARAERAGDRRRHERAQPARAR